MGTIADIEQLSYRGLQAECKRLGINAAGKKEDLAARLRTAHGKAARLSVSQDGVRISFFLQR